MPSYQEEQLTEASKTAQKKIAETEKKIGDATRQIQDEFAKTFEELSRTVMSRATAEIELGVKLTQKLGAARSFPDVMSAYQEWLNEAMNARSEDARQFMTNSQKFITASTRLFSNGRSGVGIST
jgi:vacuolar-type H+-ATPase subunit E/Vma4